MQITQDLSHAEKRIYFGEAEAKQLDDSSFEERLHRHFAANPRFKKLPELQSSPTNAMQFDSRTFDLSVLDLLQLKPPFQAYTGESSAMNYRIIMLMADDIEQRKQAKAEEAKKQALERKKYELERTMNTLTSSDTKKLTNTGRPVCVITAYLRYHPWVHKKEFAQTLRGDRFYSDPRKMINGLRGTIRQRWKELNFARIYCNNFEKPDDVIFEARLPKNQYNLIVTIDKIRETIKYFSPHENKEK